MNEFIFWLTKCVVAYINSEHGFNTNFKDCSFHIYETPFTTHPVFLDASCSSQSHAQTYWYVQKTVLMSDLWGLQGRRQKLTAPCGVLPNPGSLEKHSCQNTEQNPFNSAELSLKQTLGTAVTPLGRWLPAVSVTHAPCFIGQWAWIKPE